MLNVKFFILYKNGTEDIVKQQATEEEYNGVVKTFNDSFTEDCPAILTFGNGKDEGYFIRLSDVSRIKVEILD